MNETSADKAVRFISSLKLTGDFHGTPFKLATFQEDFVRQLIGTVDANGKRQYKTACYFLSRKSGKTFLIASLVLYFLCAEGKSSQEIYSAASSIEQSGKIFSYCVAILNQCPYLRDRCRILHNRKEIVFTPRANTYRSLSSQGSTAHGLAPSVCVTDELAQWEPRKGRLLYEALSTSFAHSQEGLFIHITTAGNSKHSLLWPEYQYAKKVKANPSFDPSYLSVIYEAPPELDWKEESTWHLAMPQLQAGFCSIEYIRNMCLQAQRIKTREASFRQYFLNQWVEANALQWFSIELWDACQANYEIPPGTPAIAGGLDVGLSNDLSSLVLLHEVEDGDRLIYRTQSFTWIAEEALKERQEEDMCPYKDWIRDGNMLSHPGKGTDFRLLRQQLNEINNQFPIMQLGIDPFSAAQLSQELENDGIPVVKYRQNFASLSPPCKALENWVLTNQIQHNNDPVLRWGLTNTRVEIDSNENIKPTKIKSTGRVDMIFALVMAIGIAIGGNPAPGEIYTIAL